MFRFTNFARFWHPTASELPDETLSTVVDNIKTPEDWKAYQEGKELDLRLRTRALADPASWRAGAILLGGVIFLGFSVPLLTQLQAGLRDQQKLSTEIAEKTTVITRLNTEIISLTKDKAIDEQRNALAGLNFQSAQLTNEIKSKNAELDSKNEELKKAQGRWRR